MVFTSAGQFRSTALLPGNYEVNVKAKDLVSDVQKLALKAGDNQTIKRVDARLQREPGGRRRVERGAPRALTFQSYDEIYPDNGPGKQVAEHVCMSCHGENFFPSQPANEAVWNARIDHMQGKALCWSGTPRATRRGSLLTGPRCSSFRGRIARTWSPTS